jgi:hypothetical protein
MWHSQETATADVTVNVDKAPDAMVQSNLSPFFHSASSLRALVHVARFDRLSLFATSAVAYYRHLGLVVDRTPPVTIVLTPREGTTLNGVEPLAAIAAEPYGVTEVAFVLSGGGFHYAPIGRATLMSHFGWTASWDTASVPNGA